MTYRRKDWANDRETDPLVLASPSKSTQMRGPVSAATRGDKSHCVNWPFLPQNLVAGIKTWSQRLVTRIQTGLNLWDKSLRRDSLCTLFKGVVARTCRMDQSPRLCRPLWFWTVTGLKQCQRWSRGQRLIKNEFIFYNRISQLSRPVQNMYSRCWNLTCKANVQFQMKTEFKGKI